MSTSEEQRSTDTRRQLSTATGQSSVQYGAGGSICCSQRHPGVASKRCGKLPPVREGQLDSKPADSPDFEKRQVSCEQAAHSR
jgi:hypothetical protein